MLTFEHVSFSYSREADTVRDLSFSVGDGEFVALIGSNGAGKSTVSRLANGLLHPQSGRVLVDGEDTSMVKTSAIARKVGFLFQNPDRQICQNTVREEIAFGPKVQGVSEDETARRTEEMLSTFHLDGDWFPFTRSRGERQRIALASVLACHPKMVILDEPTTGLDPNQIVEIRELIKNIGREKTVIMSSHILAEIEATCDRVLIINKGKIVADGTSAELRNKSDKGKLLKICIQGGEDEDIYNELALIPELENIISSTPHHFEIQCERATEIEKKIFDICCQNNWYISEMTPVETRLEDIFRQVTKN